MATGDEIRKRMKKQGISQNGLARLAGISQSGLSSIISGAVSPKEDTLQRIALALGCTTAELLGEAVDEDAFTPAERSMILTYRALTPQGQEYVRQQLAIAYQLYSGEHATFADLAK